MLVTSQVNVFLCTVAGGILIGIIYDFFRVLRKFFRTGSVAAFFEDIIFWIVVSLVLFFTLYISNDGEVRFYIFVGAAIGAALYFLTASPVLVNFMVAAVNFVHSCLKIVFKALFLPLRLIGKMAGKPAMLLLGKLTRVFIIIYKYAACRLREIRKTVRKIRRKI